VQISKTEAEIRKIRDNISNLQGEFQSKQQAVPGFDQPTKPNQRQTSHHFGRGFGF